MKGIKKAIAGVLVTCMTVGLLGGCSSSQETTESTASVETETSTESESTTSEAVESEASGEVIELTYATMFAGQQSNAEAIQVFTEKFNEEYAGQIHVTLEEYPDAEAYRTKIRTMMAASEIPDIFNINESGLPAWEKYLATDLLLDFKPYLDADTEWSEGFSAGALDEVTIDGEIQIFPFQPVYAGMMYNMQLLNDAGVDKVPETLDEFWDTCDKLKATGVTAVGGGFGAAEQWYPCQYFTMFANGEAGYDIISAASEGEVAFNDEAFVSAVNDMVRMLDYMSADAISKNDAAWTDFYAGTDAMLPHGSFMASEIEKAESSLKDNFAVGSFPGESTTMLAYVNIAFAAADQDEATNAAVVEYIKYITKGDNMEEYAAISGDTYSVTTTTDSVDLQKFITASEEADIHTATVMQTAQTDVYGYFCDNIVNVMVGVMTAEDFCDGMEAANQVALAE